MLPLIAGLVWSAILWVVVNVAILLSAMFFRTPVPDYCNYRIWVIEVGFFYALVFLNWMYFAYINRKDDEECLK